jgi:acyl-CoA dehydrogenase family protein 9
VDRVLRKHGKNIIGKQLASHRLADIMIDLFALACVLSRVNTSIEQKGAYDSAREIEILHVFTHQVTNRVQHNLKAVDDNEDEALKSLADHAFQLERFAWDTL